MGPVGPLSSAVDAMRRVVGILFMEGRRVELGLYVFIEDEEGKKDGLLDWTQKLLCSATSESEMMRLFVKYDVIDL